MLAASIAAALLVGSVWLVYGRALDAPFIRDDAPSIVENESIRQLWPLWGAGERPGSLNPPPDLPTSGRPLVNGSFALNYYFSAIHPRGYRVVNVALHTLNVLLLAALVWRTLRLPRFGGRFEAVAGPLAFAVALVWALHPLVTEAVEYVTQRTELMMTFCYLATLNASLRYWESNRFRWLAAAVLACWAGMASKEVMASAPLMVLLFDRTFNSRSIREAWLASRPLYVGLFTSWLLLFWLAAPGPHAASAGFHQGVSATEWWFTQCQVLLMYLKLAVWPWPLSIHYEPPYLTSLRDAWMYVVPVAALVVATLALVWRRSAVGYVGAFALAILAPTLVVPIVTEIAAERRMYLPLAALVALAVVCGYVVLRHVLSTRHAVVTIVTAALLLACAGGLVSSTRLDAYGDELTLWQDVLTHDPTNATAQYNVGTIYLDRHEPQRAIAYFERAVANRADHARAHFNWGSALTALGRKQEAATHFQRAIEVQPGYALGYVRMGHVHLKAGRAAEAIEQFRSALQLEPQNVEARSGLSGALLAEGHREDAQAQARTAVEFAPDNAAAHNALGAALAQAREFDEAIEQFEAAVRLEPTFALAQGNLMAAYASVGRNAEAITTAKRALELARASGDTALEAQIAAFLADFQDGPSLDANRDRD